VKEGQHSAEKAPPVQIPPQIQAAPQIPRAAEATDGVVADASPSLSDAHRVFADFHSGYVSEYIQFADTKAAWAFAVATGALAYILGNDHLREVMLGKPWSSTSLLFVATSGLVLLSAVFSFLVIVPRLGTSGEGIVYFGAVAKRRSASEYVRDVANKRDSDLTEARLKHSYDLSRVCARKYGHLRRAILLGVPGLVGLGLMSFLS
jgi:hypothetical protein